MQITAEMLAAIAGRPVNANMRSTIAGLERAGIGAGLNLSLIHISEPTRPY